MKILQEGVLIPELESDLENLQNLLSLGSGLGYRQISGLDVMTCIQVALQQIESLKTQDFGEADEVTINNFKSKQKSQIDARLEQAQKAIQTLEDQASRLSEGTKLAKKIVQELFAINFKM